MRPKSHSPDNSADRLTLFRQIEVLIVETDLELTELLAVLSSLIASNLIKELRNGSSVPSVEDTIYSLQQMVRMEIEKDPFEDEDEEDDE